MSQEFITPYTPDQNGIIERFVRSLKEECVRGNVYTCDAYVRTVFSRGCLLSYSRRGEPGDNAVNEAFFSRLKVEWADAFYAARTFGELQRLVGRTIAYYNEERYHSSLGYRTPLAFMNDLLTSHQQRVQAVS